MTMTRTAAAPGQLGRRLLEELAAIVRAAVWFVPLWVAFNTVGWAQYSIPSESMVPTLEVGDRVIVSKFSYGYSRFSLPVVWRAMPAGESRWFERTPVRGDVVVFAHPYSGKTMIKRLVGLPGDVVEVRDGRLIVNGVMANYVTMREVVRAPPGQRDPWALYQAVEIDESLNGRRHPVLETEADSRVDNWGPNRVPDAHFLMMGDNRDNSADSRLSDMGFVAAERLIGRAETVIFAPKGCQREAEVHCTRARWMQPLHRPSAQGA
jgi:signal peptidase I